MTGRIEPRKKKTWAYWKISYKRAHAKARVKAKTSEGSDEFGATNAAERVLKTREGDTNNGDDKVGMKALEGYFNNLSAAAINEKSVLKQLVATNAVQKIQVVRSTKPKPQPPSSPEEPMPQVRSNELFLQVMHISKLYIDDTGRFPIHSYIGNQYVMIAYHCNTNIILEVPFKTGEDTHRIISYDKIMQRLSYHNLTVNLKILYNEDSKE